MVGAGGVNRWSAGWAAMVKESSTDWGPNGWTGLWTGIRQDEGVPWGRG